MTEPEELPQHAGRQKALIGEDVSERLDVIRAKFRVIVTCRPKYAFRVGMNVTLPETAGSPHGGADGRSVEARDRNAWPMSRGARQAVSAPIVAGLLTLWQQTLPRIPGKPKLAEAIRYAVSRREIFERFLTDGLVELDSNIVMRAIRPQTITRKKNSLFAGSDGGGRIWATIATLMQTCKMT